MVLHQANEAPQVISLQIYLPTNLSTSPLTKWDLALKKKEEYIFANGSFFA